MKINWIKKFIRDVDDRCEYIFWTKIMKLLSEVTKKIEKLYISKIIYKYEFIFFLLKVIILVGCISVNYENLLERNIIFSSQLILWCCIIRIVLKKILYKYGWDGQHPIYELAGLKEVFKRKKFLNTLLIIFYKYINVWHLIIIIRNHIMIMLRYVRVYMLKKKKIKYWIKLEKIATYISRDIIIEYIRIIIYEIYIPLKKRLLLGELTSIIEWRLWILVVIIVFKSIPFIIKYVLIIKLIKLGRACVVYDFAKKNKYPMLFDELWDPQFKLGMLISKESYILKNLNIEVNYSYKNWLHKVGEGMGDYFYSASYYQNNDMYSGLPLRYIDKFNINVNIISSMFLMLEYVLYKKELKKYRNEAKTYLKDFEKPILLIKELIKLLNNTSKRQDLLINLILNELDLMFEIDYSELDLTKKNDNSKFTKTDEEKIVKKLWELHKISDKLYEKYEESSKKTKEYYYLCKICDWRANYKEKKKDLAKDDSEFYEKVVYKYQFLEKN